MTALERHNRFGTRLGLAAAVGVTLLALAGCPATLTELDHAKALQNDQRFEALAQLKIQCSANDEGCNQLHLIKGDACFRLAKQTGDNGTKRNRLDCAVTDLSAGIAMTKDWNQGDIDRARFYENLCESARLRADFGERPRYESVLASCAHQLAGFSPDSPGAIYFESRAEYYNLARAGNGCSGWRALDGRLAAAVQRFRSDPRYGAAYSTLKAAVGQERRRSCGQ